MLGKKKFEKKTKGRREKMSKLERNAAGARVIARQRQNRGSLTGGLGLPASWTWTVSYRLGRLGCCAVPSLLFSPELVLVRLCGVR